MVHLRTFGPSKLREKRSGVVHGMFPPNTGSEEFLIKTRNFLSHRVDHFQFRHLKRINSALKSMLLDFFFMVGSISFNFLD